MEAPLRKCCNKRHWESDWECPNGEQVRTDFDVKKAEPSPVSGEPIKQPGEPITPPKEVGGRGRKAAPLVFDPELDREGSTATDKSKRQMRSRRRKPDEHREYMKIYMREYRKKKIRERQAKEAEAEKG